MIDGIIKADGTSRLMRANLPATYEEFKAQAAAGKLPLDVLFNAEGWSQFPTFLNKANLLKDPTAGLFGLDKDAVPNTIFDWLGQYNTHWWSILHGRAGFKYVEERTPYDYKAVNISGFFINEYRGGARTIQYSETVNVNTETGEVTLNNPVSVSFASQDSNLDFADTLASVLRGKYVLNAASKETLVYISPSASISQNLYGGLKYFALAVSSGEVYDVGSGIVSIPAGETTYEHSTDRNAYPDSGTVDGLTYQYLGVPFDNAVTAPRVAALSYVGAGAKGDKEIIFPVVPKIVFVSRSDGSYVYTPYVWGASVLFGINSSASSFSKSSLDITVSGATLTAEGSTALINNLDVAGVTYTLLYIV